MIMDANFRVNKHQHTIHNLKEQLEQTMTPVHIKMVTNTIKITSLKQAEKKPPPNQTAQAKFQEQGST